MRLKAELICFRTRCDSMRTLTPALSHGVPRERGKRKPPRGRAGVACLNSFSAPQTFFMTKLALCPPKPKELLMAMSTLRSRALCGT